MLQQLTEGSSTSLMVACPVKIIVTYVLRHESELGIHLQHFLHFAYKIYFRLI
jgi:hypothetical protein